MPDPLPLLDDPPPERSDAARNRLALVEAATALVDERGVPAVTMDAVAARAGVGKGTVFRRFGSREGLMGALLHHSESGWQEAVISGPPPLGPGAPAIERLLAFGETRMRLNLRHADLIEASGSRGSESLAALSFTTLHVRYLLAELGVRGDLPYLATALVAPLEIVARHRGGGDPVPLDRLRAGWADLAHRVVATPHG